MRQLTQKLKKTKCAFKKNGYGLQPQKAQNTQKKAKVAAKRHRITDISLAETRRRRERQRIIKRVTTKDNGILNNMISNVESWCKNYNVPRSTFHILRSTFYNPFNSLSAYQLISLKHVYYTYIFDGCRACIRGGVRLYETPGRSASALPDGAFFPVRLLLHTVHVPACR